MQSEHKVCIFFTPPQAGHLFNDVTSFRAFPAICRCLFFMCDVFFLGTARSIPSHMSPSRDGIFEMAAGMAIASSVTDGSLDSCAYCVYRTVDRKEDWKLVDAILGRGRGRMRLFVAAGGRPWSMTLTGGLTVAFRSVVVINGPSFLVPPQENCRAQKKKKKRMAIIAHAYEKYSMYSYW